MDRRIGGPGERHRPGGRDRLDVRRARARVEAWRDVAPRQGGRHRRVQQDRVLAVDLEHPAARTHERHRVVQRAIGQAEVEHHERLRGRDAGIDRGGQFGERVVHPATHDEAQAVVDGTVRVRGRAPFAQAGAQAQLGRGRRSGARVVEREERGRAAERRRDRVLEEAVGRRVRGHPRVGVDVDDAGEDEHPGRVDDVTGLGGQPAEVGLDGLDAAAAHGNVRPA